MDGTNECLAVIRALATLNIKFFVSWHINKHLIASKPDVGAYLFFQDLCLQKGIRSRKSYLKVKSATGMLITKNIVFFQLLL